MANGRLVYRIPGASWTLELPAEALAAVQARAQKRWWSKEAVGQLYTGDPSQSSIRVDAVTRLAPRSTSRAGLRLDIPAVDEERKLMFDQGLHCLGFWHTHPEAKPSPSPDDIELAAEHARASKSSFAGLVFVILGTSPLPEGLGVWVHDGTILWRALLEADSSPAVSKSAAILNHVSEHYISVDIEASGPIPGEYSMLSLGAVSVDDESKQHYVELKPLNEAKVDSEALRMTGLSLSKLLKDGQAPSAAMQAFAAWVASVVPAGSKPVFVGLNAPFDWSFVNYYFVRFAGSNPFGHAALDIKALYMGVTGCAWSQATARQMVGRLKPKTKGGTHHALEDAIFQAELFRQTRRLKRE